jgi:hypothetical protein
MLHQESIESGISTSSMSFPDDAEELLYQDTVLIQKLIKGKAIQNMLMKGKTVYQELIDYIRSNHSIEIVKELFPDGFDQQSQEKDKLFKEYKKIESVLKNDVLLQEDLKKLAEHKKFKTLENELERLKLERKGQALYLLAERERYERETTNLSKESEDQSDSYESLKSQYEAISKYLEYILLEGIDRVSVENPREYVRKIAKKIDIVASESLDSESSTECYKKTTKVGTPKKKIFTHLLKENMVPEMFGKIKAEQFRIRQRSHLNIIHKNLYEIAETPVNEFEQLQLICKDMIEEIILKAFDYIHQDFSDLSSTPPKSSDSADCLAAQIVESILTELTQGLNFTSNSESSKSPRSSISSSLRRSSDSLETRESESCMEFDDLK